MIIINTDKLLLDPKDKISKAIGIEKMVSYEIELPFQDKGLIK
ncbi:MAG: hypothetical protein WCK31_01250 [bacterium]